MKIGGIRDGTVYVTHGRSVGKWDSRTGFQRRGKLPVPNRARSSFPEWLVAKLDIRDSLQLVVGSYSTANVWPIEDDILLGTTTDAVFRSVDDGATWTQVHELPATSGPMGVLPTSLAETNGRVYLAEYPLRDHVARILISEDGGRTWSRLIEDPTVCHFHGVVRDPYTDTVWATSGDAPNECAIGPIHDGIFQPVGEGSERWRAVDLTFTPDGVIWGMDSPIANEVEILWLDRDQFEMSNPTPTRIGMSDRSVFFSRSITDDNECWIVLSTAAEIGRAVPDRDRGPSRPPAVRVLVASHASRFHDWHTLCAYRRRSVIADRVPGIHGANAYAFIDVHPELGLLINPYNTVEADGTVVSRQPKTFRDSPKSADRATAPGSSHSTA